MRRLPVVEYRKFGEGCNGAQTILENYSMEYTEHRVVNEGRDECNMILRGYTARTRSSFSWEPYRCNILDCSCTDPCGCGGIESSPRSPSSPSSLVTSPSQPVFTPLDQRFNLLRKAQREGGGCNAQSQLAGGLDCRLQTIWQRSRGCTTTDSIVEVQHVVDIINPADDGGSTQYLFRKTRITDHSEYIRASTQVCPDGSLEPRSYYVDFDEEPTTTELNHCP